MKKLLVFGTALILAFTACKSRKPSVKDPWLTKFTANDNLITPGFGSEDFKVGMSIDEVVAKLGARHVDTNYAKYSTAVEYPQYGLKFYYMQADTGKKVFSIHFFSPFRGYTERGISIGKNTMKDAIDKYGEAYWLTSKDSDEWHNEYPIGIIFYVKRDMSVPQFPLDEKLHEQKTIYAISVKKEGSN